jgi:hypothetical protein
LLTPALEKSHLKPFSDFGKNTYKTKPALPNNFSLGPKEIWEVFDGFVFLMFFASWDLLGHEANSKSATG